MEQIQIFYGYWQLIVCLFAFVGLISIWHHLGRKQKDTGQIWLAISILCWSISGGLDVLPSHLPQINAHYFEGGQSILSLLNSFFILLALPFFRYLPRPLESTIKSKYWLALIGLPLIFSILPTLSKLFISSTNMMISELDVYYSILTLLILGWVLWESFRKRNLYLLAYLSIFCIAITFVAQLYKLLNDEFYQLLFSAIFKTNLIMIFFALALSWVKDMSEKISVNPKRAQLKLRIEKLKSGKFAHLLNLEGVYEEDKEIHISPTHYELLKKFAEIRKTTEDGWLEIKPKNSIKGSQHFDIKDYNEIKRMLHGILDGYFGKSKWSKEVHEAPLKNLLLERSSDRDRQIRLRLDPDNIYINASIPTT